MYLINKAENSMTKLENKNFKDLNFSETNHLQEWIAKTPSCLGEDILIIQKEFDGFDDTWERIDLLALDKNANLVIIENKLDDSTKDVTWQALKYASYCSTLNKNQIIEIFQNYLNKYYTGQNAVECLKSFYDTEDLDDINFNENLTQRLFLVAKNFRKEVTSTVLWLLNFKINIKCFQTSLYTHKEQIFFTIEQIIPTKNSEDYLIKMAEKEYYVISEKYRNINKKKINYEFWEQFLDKFNKKSDLFNGINPGYEDWIQKTSGSPKIYYLFRITYSYASVELVLNNSDKNINKNNFDYLIKHKEDIEQIFGKTFNWSRKDEGKQSTIIYKYDNVSKSDKADYNKINNFFIEYMPKLHNAFKDIIRKIPIQNI